MHGFDVLRWRDENGDNLPASDWEVVETNYGWENADDCAWAAVRRCNELGTNFVYRRFNHGDN